MAKISGWMIYPVDDITEFYCTKQSQSQRRRSLRMRLDRNGLDVPRRAVDARPGLGRRRHELDEGTPAAAAAAAVGGRVASGGVVPERLLQSAHRPPGVALRAAAEGAQLVQRLLRLQPALVQVLGLGQQLHLRWEPLPPKKKKTHKKSVQGSRRRAGNGVKDDQQVTSR